jgi:SAM-dependent methyltransferase
MHFSTKAVARSLVHLVADPRKFYYRKVSEFAGGIKNKKILELGSGPKVKNEYYYSTKHLFHKTNDFLQSDIVKDFGHPIVDVTKMKFINEFDAIMCLNVLEHVYEYQRAVQNLYRALKQGGTLVIAVPYAYPLHDEPGDYWRFSEHALRKILSDFKNVDISYKGKREFPFGYYVEAKK